MKNNDKSPYGRLGGALFALCASLTIPALGWAAVETGRPVRSASNLADLSLEELIDIEITSVSKRSEKLGEAAAAIFVITAEDIRRSGVTSIPEALRLAPNLQVARVDSSQYAISARGFNSTTANKLLVLIDGRSVYTPLFSGVFWDAQDTLLEDIERIEVISGPGATLWGSNAVNGVINIITRSAHETQGALLKGGGGTQERAFAGVRYGGKLSEGASYRVYGKYFDRDNTTLASGAPASDAWHKGQAGFRLDWARQADTLTLQGDIYRGAINQPLFDNKTIEGANVLGRWRHTWATDSSLQLQVYYDHLKRDYPGTFGETRNTFDVDVQHSFKLAERHEIVWGGGYRSSSDRIRNSAGLAFLPANTDLALASIFVEDHIALLDDRIELTLGSRWEHNEFTGMEVQPGARLSWKVFEHHFVWAAVSRAVRTPSRIDRDFFVPSTPPFILAGGPGFRSEKVNAYEIGYRTNPNPRISLAVSAFYNDYKNLRTLEPVPGTGAFVFGNGMAGKTYGVEIWGDIALSDSWRVKPGYAFLEKDLRLVPGSGDTGVSGAGNDAKHRFVLLSTMNISPTIELDATLSYVSALPAPAVPAYTTLDVRLGWKPTKQVELSLIGQNLLDKRHPEFGQPSTRSELERGVLVKAVWKF